MPRGRLPRLKRFRVSICMAKPSKQFRILHSDGTYGYISRKRAERCLEGGYAKLVRNGVIKLCSLPTSDSSPFRVRPAWGPAIAVIPASASDSGQSGFLRYPMPCGINSSPKFPGLFKVGAGLL